MLWTSTLLRPENPIQVPESDRFCSSTSSRTSLESVLSSSLLSRYPTGPGDLLKNTSAGLLLPSSLRRSARSVEAPHLTMTGIPVSQAKASKTGSIRFSVRPE